MKRRSDANSVDAAVRAMVNAAKGTPAVPAHCRLRKGDLPFWLGVVRARALDEWTDADLVVAAQLARCQADIEREQELLDGEQTVIANERGTMVVNARVSVLEQFARREMALMRSLRMAGRALGDTADLQGKRKIERDSRKLRDELKDDELLAS